MKSKAFYTLLALAPPVLVLAILVLSDVNRNAVIEAQAHQTTVATTQ